MNRRILFQSSLLIFSFLLFFNGWVEDKVFELELRPRLNAPYVTVDGNFVVLQARYSEALKERDRFDTLSKEILSSSNARPSQETVSYYTNSFSILSRTLPDLKTSITAFKNENESAYRSILLLLGEETNSMSKGSLVSAAMEEIENKKQLYAAWAATTEVHVQAIADGIILKNEEVQKKLKHKITRPVISQLKSSLTNKISTPLSVKLEDIISAMNTQKQPANSKESLNLYNDGNKLMESGQYNEAMKKLQQSLEYDKNNYKAMRSIAEIYILDRNYDQAIKVINKAIDTYRNNVAVP